MKILLATTVVRLNGGGIASYNQEVLSVLKKTHIVDILTTENISELDGCNKIYVLDRLLPNRFSEFAKITKKINKENYNLIINSDSALISVISPFLKSPIITVSHTLNNMPAIEAGFNAKYVNKIIALSKAGKLFIERYFHIKDTTKVCYIYNFVQHNDNNLSDFKSKRNKLNIVFPGGASLMKYPEMVLLAVNKLLKSKYDFNFYWLGSGQLPLRKFSIPKNIQQLATSDSRLVFTGKIPRDEAQKYIDDANIFILPSRAEGCPISLVEAMCTGCIPIVGSAKHVCREMLEDGHFGVIVQQGSHKSLYKAIIDILQNHTKYHYNYQYSYKYSKENLREEIWQKKMNEAITEAISYAKEQIPLSRCALYSSLYSFKYHAKKMTLKDNILSIKGYIKFNLFFIKQRLSR